jgi:hypothetical protein
MCDSHLNWKEERVRALKESLAFFGNKEKLNREKWVVRRLLHALAIGFEEEEMTGAEEPVDVSFRDARFQVKEILEEGRRRTDEFKTKLEKAKSAKDYDELLEYNTPIDISFSEVVRHCYGYARTLLSQSKYGPRECKNIDLICYFNWLDHYIVPPIEIPNEEVGFRSLSVVSNGYCAVAYVGTNAPRLLRDNVSKAIEHFSTIFRHSSMPL